MGSRLNMGVGAHPPLKTVLVVDDHEIIRDGVSEVIKNEFKGFQARSASSCGEAMGFVQCTELALVITGLSFAGRSGIDLIQEISAFNYSLPILVYTTHSEKEYGMRAIKSGAWGYVEKSSGVSDLIKAIQQMLMGKRYISPDLAQTLISIIRKDTDRKPHDLLSAREFQIICKLAKGITIKEIGSELSLSVKTVSTYRARIFVKLEIISMAGLVRYAVEHKLC